MVPLRIISIYFPLKIREHTLIITIEIMNQYLITVKRNVNEFNWNLKASKLINLIIS